VVFVKYREIQPCVWRKGEEVTLAACLANIKEFQWGLGMSLPKINDLFTVSPPLLFSTTQYTWLYFSIFFIQNRRGSSFYKHHGKEKYWLPS
jgi:hypothetical protein